MEGPFRGRASGSPAGRWGGRGAARAGGEGGSRPARWGGAWRRLAFHAPVPTDLRKGSAGRGGGLWALQGLRPPYGALARAGHFRAYEALEFSRTLSPLVISWK